MGYNGTCPDGTPHHRLTGNIYIAEKVPSFFESHLARDGYEWQLCIKCGDCFELGFGADPDHPKIIRPDGDKLGSTEAPSKRPPGTFSMHNKPSNTIISFPGFVTTTVASKRLGVQRPQIREYIKSGALVAKKELYRGCYIWLVEIDSLGKLWGKRYGEDLVDAFLDGLEASGFQLAREAVEASNGGKNDK